jgi:hypothetical protein
MTNILLIKMVFAQDEQRPINEELQKKMCRI